MVSAQENPNSQITPGRQAALDVVQRMQEAQLLRFGPPVEVALATDPVPAMTTEERNIMQNNPGHIPYLNN